MFAIRTVIASFSKCFQVVNRILPGVQFLEHNIDPELAICVSDVFDCAELLAQILMVYFFPITVSLPVVMQHFGEED